MPWIVTSPPVPAATAVPAPEHAVAAPVQAVPDGCFKTLYPAAAESYCFDWAPRSWFRTALKCSDGRTYRRYWIAQGGPDASLVTCPASTVRVVVAIELL